MFDGTNPNPKIPIHERKVKDYKQIEKEERKGNSIKAGTQWKRKAPKKLKAHD